MDGQEQEKLMSNLYKKFSVSDGVFAQYAGVHVVRWRWEWGEPSALFVEDESQQELVSTCIELCEAIKLMGELKCYSESGAQEAEFIEANWLEYVPTCQADAYRHGMEVIEKYS